MSTSEPIHVAFVWHMHQPYYRSARTGAFHMPWARLHALKDYLDMLEVLADYPSIHQTFNLVPSLVEQLADYAAGTFRDVYWEHTMKAAEELQPNERIFVLERMCERPDHPRAKTHPRYLELAQKRAGESTKGWDACSHSFTVDELRDLQIWFNLAWFDPALLDTEPLSSLVRQERDYQEEDKLVLAEVQRDILARIIPAYRGAAAQGQIELSTSPYFHPILPLLCNTDSARVGSAETVLPRRRFAHAEDAWEQIESALVEHERVFGARPRGMWCSEEAVGEDVLPLLLRARVRWTISDETVLARSVAGTSALPALRPIGSSPPGAWPAPPSPYLPYLLRREEGEMAIVFRDHTLSDLIGFGYQSWDSRDAAYDLIGRIRAIGSRGATGAAADSIPLVTIALDGENAWEYYPRDGRDFLRYLYEGLATEPTVRCVTVSEHLDHNPATQPLDWLHTGSWIGGDLRTWSGDPGHNAAWDLLHDARDLAASRRAPGRRQPQIDHDPEAEESGRSGDGPDDAIQAAEQAWHSVLIAEGSDWFWWFGDHHHTDLDYVWDLEFRQHLQKVYRLLGEPVPIPLYLPILSEAASGRSAVPLADIHPVIDGRLLDEDGWDAAGLLASDLPSTMQRADGAHIVEARFGWGSGHLYLLLIPRDAGQLDHLELELEVTPAADGEPSVFNMILAQDGGIEVRCNQCAPGHEAGGGAWRDVVEVALPLGVGVVGDDRVGLVLRAIREGMIDHVFRSAGPARAGEVKW